MRNKARAQNKLSFSQATTNYDQKFELHENMGTHVVPLMLSSLIVRVRNFVCKE